MAVNKIYIPTFISSVDYQPARVLPHIYFFNGLKECEPWYIEHYTSSVAQNEVTASVQTSFPYFDYYDALEPISSSNSLLFFNETPAYGVTPTGSLYTQYWDKYVSLLYNPKTRLIDASAIIPLADYFAMELNDIVQWRGNMYHLRAINDYNLKDGTCKLQLLGPIISDSTVAVRPTINCDFNFSSSVYVFPATTTTTTIQPTTTTLPPEFELVNFELNNFITTSVDVARAIFEDNDENLFRLNNIIGQSVSSTSSLQTLTLGPGGLNDISTKWQIDASGSGLVRYDYTQSLYLDGVLYASNAGNVYTDVTDVITKTLASNISLPNFATYSIDLSFREFTGESYIRNAKLDFDNNTSFDISASRIKFSSNPDDLFVVNNIPSGSNIISSSNVFVYTPFALNTISSDFKFDYPGGIIDFDYTASLSINGVFNNAISGAAFVSSSNYYSVLLNAGTDISASVSYSVDWEINNGTSGEFRHFTSRLFGVGNTRETVCAQGINEFDNFAYTSESLQPGTQLWEDPAFTIPFTVLTSSGFDNDWINIVKPYQATTDGIAYRVSSSGEIIETWSCDDRWVNYTYQANTSAYTGNAYSFTNPYGETSYVYNKGFTALPEVSFIAEIGSLAYIGGTGTLTMRDAYFNVTEALDRSIVDGGQYVWTALTGQMISSSDSTNGYTRIPVFTQQYTASAEEPRAFSTYILNDADAQVYLPATSSLAFSLVSPQDFRQSGDYSAFRNGIWSDLSGLGNLSTSELWNNTIYGGAVFNADSNSVDLSANDYNGGPNSACVRSLIANSFDVKSLSIVYDVTYNRDTATIFDLRNLTGVQDSSNNYAFLSGTGGNTNNWTTSSMWYSGSYFIYDSTTDTHYDAGFTTSSNMIGTGSSQYPGPVGLGSGNTYGKRVMTINFNPSGSFIGGTLGQGQLFFGANRGGTAVGAAPDNGLGANLYGVFMWTGSLSYEDHINLTNLLITKNIISGSIQ